MYKTRDEFMNEQAKDLGLKAVHPDDGWVTNDHNNNPIEIRLCYPWFQLPIGINDEIGLYADDCLRVFKVVEKDIRPYFLTAYKIEYVKAYNADKETGLLTLDESPRIETRLISDSLLYDFFCFGMAFLAAHLIL